MRILLIITLLNCTFISCSNSQNNSEKDKNKTALPDLGWIDKKSALLMNNEKAILFKNKFNLKTEVSSINGTYFYNEHIILHMYEELGYLYCDYYDLKNLRWREGLENAAIGAEIIPLDQARKIHYQLEAETKDDIFPAKLMTKFFFYLEIIDRYMAEIIEGKFDKYENLLKPLDGIHKAEIEEFIKTH